MTAPTRTLLWLYVAALALYTPGIWWGLPEGVPGKVSPWGTDEIGPVGAINEVYGVFAANNPTFNPQYPLFQYLTQLIFVAPFYVLLWVTGHISYPAPMFPFGMDHPAVELKVLTLLARAGSLLMAAGVVTVAFLTGQVLRDRRTGLAAAFLVLVQYPMFYYARTSNVDMGALFWTSLALLVFAACLRDGTTPRRWLLFGLCAALATASKDPSYAPCLTAGVVMFGLDLHRRAEGRSAWSLVRPPLVALIAAAIVYAMASGLAFRPSRYQQHLQFVTQGSGGGVFYFRYPPTASGYASFATEFCQQLVDAMGIPMLAVAIVGTLWWSAADRRRLLWLLPALGLFVGVIVPVRFALLRFVIIIAYALAFPAADLLARSWTHGRPVIRRTALIALAVVLVCSAVRGADLTRQMLIDGRDVAAEWLEGAVRRSDRVGHLVERTPHMPRLPDAVTRVPVDPRDVLTLLTEARPEFFVSMPLEDYERDHERRLPPDVYRRLLDGQLGYQLAGVFQTPSLFARRPATFVNPPLRIFVREDVWRERLLAQRVGAPPPLPR